MKVNWEKLGMIILVIVAVGVIYTAVWTIIKVITIILLGEV